MTAEEIFENRMKEIIGKYCPNKDSIHVISHVLLGLALEALKTSDQSVEDISFQITQMDIGSLIKSLKDISVYVSQDIVESVLRDTYRSLKNMIPLRKVNSERNVALDVPNNVSNYESNEVSFDIDIESIPKVSKRTKVQSNEFNGENVSIDFEKFNSYKPDVDISVSVSSEEDNYSNVEELDNDTSVEDGSTFTTDGSMFTSESYDNIPNMSVGLDY